MRKFTIVPLFLILLLQAGCGTMNDASHKNVPEDIRDMFVGTWEGEYMDPGGTLLRTWIQNRSENGTYTIVFFHHTQKGIYKSTQEGKWWLKGNRFHEIAPDLMKEPDVYQFEILSEDEIRFRSIVKDYEFTDKRTESSLDRRGVWF